MKHENLFRAVGQVEDALIQEAAETTCLAAPQRTVPWRQWCALAAALALVLGLGAFARWALPASGDSSGAPQEGQDIAEPGLSGSAIQEGALYDRSQDGIAEAAEPLLPALTVTGAAAITVDPSAPAEEQPEGSTSGQLPDEDSENGTTQARRALPGSAVACGPDGTLTADFGGDTPETLTVSWYQEDAWESGGGPYSEEPAQPAALVPPDGAAAWVAKVTAAWPDGRIARYVFRVTP